jgi:hypothetical protein
VRGGLGVACRLVVSAVERADQGRTREGHPVAHARTGPG